MASGSLPPSRCFFKGPVQKKTTLASTVGELPLDPRQRTGTDGSDPLNVCAKKSPIHGSMHSRLIGAATANVTSIELSTAA